MIFQPTLLYHETPTASDLRLAQLSDVLGVSCNLVSASTLISELDQTADHSLCILVSANTLCYFATGSSLIERLLRKARFLFVYGFAPTEAHSSLACFLADGLISRLYRFTRNDLEYRVASSHPEITREFSGLSFGPIKANIDSAFAPSSGANTFLPLVSIEGMPFWGLVERARCSVFLLACEEIIDINELTDGNLNVAERFSRLLPAAMFLKSIFKQSCWHTRHRFANFIIDDPLLKESYGFLNYRQLLKLTDRIDFSVTIGFVPRNYKNTQRTVADLFRQRSDRLSICVHGCDHSEAEFVEQDIGALNTKIGLASQRMRMHEASTGVPYCEVMVFPYGRFSAQSLRALKANNYLACTNARVTPTDVENECDVPIADCLDIAVTKYGFPLFLRRYPVLHSSKGRRTGTVEEFAADLFFGKPALIVEHHDFFRDHGETFLEFVNRLNSLSSELEWTGLKEVVTRTYLEKDVSDQLRVVKIYTNYQLIENDGDRARNFEILKTENGDVPVQNVLIDGKGARFTVDDNQLRVFTRLSAGTSATVQVVYRNSLPSADVHGGWISTGRLLTRRLWSDLRDNILCNEFLFARTNAAKRVVERLGTRRF